MERGRRIVLIGPMHPYRGGIAHFFESLYRELSIRGHEVSAITFTRQYPKWLFPGRTQFEPDTASLESGDAERMLDTVNPLTWYAGARHIRRMSPDVAVFKYWMPFFAPVFGVMARSLARHGIRTLAVVDNALPHERRPGDVALGRYFFSAIQGCVVMSRAVSRDMDKMGVAIPRVLSPHPVYDVFGAASDPGQARAWLELPKEAQVLLFFGFVRRYKGLHVLLNALPKVRAALPHAHLVVAGEFYEDEQEFQRLITNQRLADCVTIHNGYVPKDRVADYFAASDVVVQPYLSATQSGVAQVAFQFGKPLIVTDVGGLADDVPHEVAGLVVPPDNPDVLADAVIRYFMEGLAGKLTAGAVAQRRQNSWVRLIESLELLM